MDRFDRAASIIDSSDGGVSLHLFSKGKLSGGGSRRFVVVAFDGDGAAILFKDREAPENAAVVECVDVSIQSLGVWLLRAEDFLREADEAPEPTHG